MNHLVWKQLSTPATSVGNSRTKGSMHISAPTSARFIHGVWIGLSAVVKWWWERSASSSCASASSNSDSEGGGQEACVILWLIVFLVRSVSSMQIRVPFFTGFRSVTSCKCPHSALLCTKKFLLCFRLKKVIFG